MANHREWRSLNDSGATTERGRPAVMSAVRPVASVSSNPRASRALHGRSVGQRGARRERRCPGPLRPCTASPRSRSRSTHRRTRSGETPAGTAVPLGSCAAAARRRPGRLNTSALTEYCGRRWSRPTRFPFICVFRRHRKLAIVRNTHMLLIHENTNFRWLRNHAIIRNATTRA